MNSFYLVIRNKFSVAGPIEIQRSDAAPPILPSTLISVISTVLERSTYSKTRLGLIEYVDGMARASCFDLNSNIVGSMAVSAIKDYQGIDYGIFEIPCGEGYVHIGRLFLIVIDVVFEKEVCSDKQNLPRAFVDLHKVLFDPETIGRLGG